jgi:hypothetical protein
MMLLNPFWHVPAAAGGDYSPSIAGYTLLLDANRVGGVADGVQFTPWANAGSAGGDVRDSGSDRGTFHAAGGPSGHDAVGFVAANQDKFQALAGAPDLADIIGTSADYYFLFVVRPDHTGDTESSGSGDRYYRSPPFLQFASQLIFGLTTQKFVVHHNQLSGHFVKSNNFTVGQWYIVEGWFESGTMTLRVSGGMGSFTRASSTAPSALTSPAHIGQGSNGYISCRIALELGYPTALNSTDRDALQAEAASRYAITL